jgi:hypothetical protein
MHKNTSVALSLPAGLDLLKAMPGTINAVIDAAAAGHITVQDAWTVIKMAGNLKRLLRDRLDYDIPAWLQSELDAISVAQDRIYDLPCPD